MRNLTIGDLKVALTDLFDTKRELFAKSVSGRLYGPLLEAKWKDIAQLPDELTGGLPLAQDLGKADAVHDGLGAAIWHLCSAWERYPAASDAQREAAKAVREAFVPGLAELERTYADQVAAASERRERVAELSAQMDLLPVGGGQSVAAWVDAFLDQGAVIDQLLSQREAYKTVDAKSRNEAGMLRSATIDLLTRCRLALADELKVKSVTLDESYDHQVFGYFDELGKLHE